MSYKIAFFDIDGTLVNEDKEVPADTIEAIAELKSRGVEVVIATGRAPYFFKPLAELLDIDSFVSLNGAYVVYRGQPLFKRIISRTSLEALVDHAAKHNHSLVFQGGDAFFSNSDAHPYVMEAVSSLKVDLPGYDPDYWKSADIYQAFLHCQEEDEHLYNEVFPDLRLIRWHRAAMDVLPLTGSKAQGLEAMLQHLNLSPAEAVAFGDGLNDKEMLMLAGLGIAMGNSHEQLKPYADYITTDVDKGGIRNGLLYAGLLEQ
ncbi:Cof-type HAD-IIB family hydrolase [Paenibacillus eucommiae]|uniref:Cof subfamily protein (Haloacid dehalogenase superfamily) n=1 Tax=Paenibacillus eucommiae TaxID=1355755 RepID=A0ABS4J2J9_9BACL|nr:Cof-type HAD-IIB family hydrolase [Paenibacillus eucommiae]MBP1994071.1 Cof subfamily protein (haloacid dehalogenase superfamily) [Paenibacillus eucommiae]